MQSKKIESQLTRLLSKSLVIWIFGGLQFIAVVTLASGPIFKDVDVNINATEGVPSVLPLTTFIVTGHGSSNVTSCYVDNGTFNITNDDSNSSLFDLRLSDGSYLDYDVISSYIINVTCEDDTNDATSVTIQIIILQNMPPVLVIPTMSITVSESETSSRILLRLNVSDIENDAISCAPLTSPTSDAFNLTLEEEIYNLYLSSDPGLDFGVISTYNVTLECWDAYGNSSVIVTVDVIRETLPPVFENVTTFIDVLEGATDVSTLATFNVTDPDGGDVTSCWLNNSDFYVTREQLNETVFGIRVASGANLDYDVMSSYDIDFTCIDDDNETASVSLQINVIENQPPMIEIPAGVYTVLDTETFPRILLTLNVSDVESDTFSCIHLTLPTSVAFSLTLEGDAYKLYLTSDPGLDYDVIPTYNVTLKCWDAFGNSSGIVTVDVIDVTLPPVFKNVTTSIDVLEGATDVSTLTTFNVTDPDGGYVMSCWLNNSDFHVNREQLNGTVFGIRVDSGENLDYDFMSSYDINVTCIDDDNETASVSIQINVIENQPPMIEIPAGAFTVLDTETSARILLTLNVSDVENDTFSCIHLTSPTSVAFSLTLEGDAYTMYLTSDPGLDFDVISMYNVTLECWDAFGNSSVVLTVDVIKVTLPPVFENVSSSIDVLEGATDVSTLSTFNVTDPDGGDVMSCWLNNSDFYVTREQLNGTVFGLLVDSGANLDYDVISSYDINVTCIDDDNETASVSIQINIIENQPPMIEIPAGVFTVLDTETSPRLLLTLNVSDAENDTFSCIHLTSPSSVAFSLTLEGDAYTLYLTSDPGLDYDAIPTYNVTLECWDAFGNSSVVLTVDVIDITLPPVFANVMTSIDVLEAATDVSTLATFNVTDPDGGDITSCSLNGDYGDFGVNRNATNGMLFDLRVNSVVILDYDVMSSYEINVTCIDDDNETASVTFHINVIENQPPVIEIAAGVYTVLETETASRLIMTLNVSDVENDAFYCVLKSSSPSSTAFVLNLQHDEYSLHLTSYPGLDYDVTPAYNVTIECWDAYGNASVLVKVDVIDVTFPPVFEGITSLLDVVETTSSGRSLETFNVTDPDGDGVTSCTLNGDNGHFSVIQDAGNNSSFSLHIAPAASLDCDVISAYDVNITCFDMDNEASSTIIRINILPNRPPSVEAPTSLLTVLETETTQRRLLTLNVSDAEHDSIACVHVSTTPTCTAFGLQRQGIDYILKLNANPGLNYDVTTTYNVTVECSDSYNSSIIVIVIDVIDVTSPPVFRFVSPVAVIESVTNASPLTTINVTDPDSGNVTSCHHSGDGGMFSLIRHTLNTELFDLFLSPGRSLDYDVTRTYNVNVTCVDTDNETSSIVIRINVLQNNAPRIVPQSAAITVVENEQSSRLLQTLTVSDVEGDVVNCTHVGTSPSSAAFTLILEGSDFNLYLTDNPGLDYDRTSAYDVTLKCFDPYGTSNVIFEIDVTPTGPPEFTALDSPLLFQDGTTGYVVLDVFDVTDPDGGSVTCSHSGDAGTFKVARYLGDTFHLALRSEVTLNYDVIPTYVINITCYDGVGDNTTITSIVIVKPNEPPLISSPVRAVTVSENDVSQHLMYTLDVSDAENNTFACSLTSILPNTSAFGFWQNGTDYGLHLLNNANLKYAVTSSYDVTVSCWDQKGNSSMTFVVYVIPNYPPLFTNLPAPDIILNANITPIGTHVFTASATDVDSAVVTYSMTSLPEEPELFEIDEARGEIWTVVHLKVAVDSGYLLAITATDGKANTTEYRRVRLTNVNSVPVIQNLPNAIYVNENTAFNTVLYTLTLDDPGDSVTVTFTVSPASLGNKFYIYSNTQLRQHYNLLDYEECNYFVVTFYAYDGKATSEPYTLTINVINVNEACDFTPNVYYVSLDEGNSYSNYVDPMFNVNDVDDGDNMTFEIVRTSSTESTYFAINQSTGVITHALNYDVDNGVHPSDVTLKVICVDAGGFAGTATVSVTVNDVNDNVPTFSMASYVRTISQYDGPGTTLFNMQNQVTDHDSGDNAVVVFAARAVTAGSNSYFHWTPEGVGMLMVYADDVMRSGDVHRFILTATDRGQPQLSSTTTVDIIFEVENSTTSTTEVTLVTEASSGVFWEQTSNIVLVTFVCVLGVLLIGMAAFLALRLLIGRVGIMRPLSPQFRKIYPKPTPHPEPFEFWSVRENRFGGVVHNGLANPSV